MCNITYIPTVLWNITHKSISFFQQKAHEMLPTLAQKCVLLLRSCYVYIYICLTINSGHYVQFLLPPPAVNHAIVVNHALLLIMYCCWSCNCPENGYQYFANAEQISGKYNPNTLWKYNGWGDAKIWVREAHMGCCGSPKEEVFLVTNRWTNEWTCTMVFRGKYSAYQDDYSDEVSVSPCPSAWTPPLISVCCTILPNICIHFFIAVFIFILTVITLRKYWSITSTYSRQYPRH